MHFGVGKIMRVVLAIALFFMKNYNIIKSAVSSIVDKFVAQHFDEVFKALIKFGNAKFSLDQETVENLAAHAAWYVIRPALDGKAELPSSVEHWIARACIFFKMRACSELRKHYRSIVEYSLDETMVDDDGIIRDDKVSSWSYDEWRRHEFDEARAEYAKDVFDVRDQLFAELGFTSRAANIFIAYDLYQYPVEAVERMFDTSRGAIYVVVHRVREVLKSKGPDAVRRLLGEAA